MSLPSKLFDTAALEALRRIAGTLSGFAEVIVQFELLSTAERAAIADTIARGLDRQAAALDRLVEAAPEADAPPPAPAYMPHPLSGELRDGLDRLAKQIDLLILAACGSSTDLRVEPSEALLVGLLQASDELLHLACPGPEGKL